MFEGKWRLFSNGYRGGTYRSGIGLESERFVDPWDMMWHWESRLLDVEDWCNVPLGAAK